MGKTERNTQHRPTGRREPDHSRSLPLWSELRHKLRRVDDLLVGAQRSNIEEVRERREVRVASSLPRGADGATAADATAADAATAATAAVAVGRTEVARQHVIAKSNAFDR